MLGLTLILGTVSTTFAAQDKDKTEGKKKKGKGKSNKTKRVASKSGAEPAASDSTEEDSIVFGSTSGSTSE